MYRSSGTQDRQFRELGENSELKKFHEYLKKEVQVILNRHGIAPSRETVEDPPGIGKRGGRMKTSRGADTGFINNLKKQWSTLKQLVESLEVQASQANAGHVISVTDHEKELTRLREEIITLKEELQMSKELISQQQQLLQDQLLPKPGESVSSPLWDAYFLEEQLRLEQDREAFEEQKLAFQDEREKFTEAAIRLGRERLQFKSDQALFIKQQFLNMTPGLGTPPWKNTPPWSALTPDSVKRSPRHPKVSFTPYGANKSQSKVGTTLDPATPSTAELYRVLRLAPPSRCTAESQRPVRSIKRKEIKPERAQRWSDSLSSMSESSEPEALPQSMLPLKSMTPYLRPRHTPLSLPRNAYDSLTPSTANLFRMRKLTPSTSPFSGKREHGRLERLSLYNSLHNAEHICEVRESACGHENSKNCNCYEISVNQKRTRVGSEDDCTQSRNEKRETMEDQEHSVCEERACRRESSEILEQDSLCKTSSVHERDTKYYKEVSSPIDDSRYNFKCDEVLSQFVNDLGKSSRLSLPGEASLHNSIQCRNCSKERSCTSDRCMRSSKENLLSTGLHKSCSNETLQLAERQRSNSREVLNSTTIHRSRSRDSLNINDCFVDHIREGVHPTDTCKTLSRADRRSSENSKGDLNETPHCTDNHRRQSVEMLYTTDSCRRLRNQIKATELSRRKTLEAFDHVDPCRSKSRENLYLTDSCRGRLRDEHYLKEMHRSRSRETLHATDCQKIPAREDMHCSDNCRNMRGTSCPTDSHRRLSREYPHCTDSCRSRAKEMYPNDCKSNERLSYHWRVSGHHRDSLYTSGPGRSPLHLRSSCPSALTPKYPPSYICADLLSQFLDCSS